MTDKPMTDEANSYSVLQKEELVRVRHYKGGEYTVLSGGALHTETADRLVVYRESTGAVWVRPADMFYDMVTVDGQAQRRFVGIAPTSGA